MTNTQHIYWQQQPKTTRGGVFLPIKTLANFLFLGGLTFFLYSFFPILMTIAQNLLPTPRQSTSFGDLTPIHELPLLSSSFGTILRTPPPLPYSPINTEGSIVIEKIQVNAPLVFDITTGDPKKYFAALEQGVAHAEGTKKPGEVGNSYLFAHSTANPLEIKKYGAVFTKLKDLVKDDRIVIFYQGKRLDFLVVKNEVVADFDLTPLTRDFETPMLTLQTCDPPGIARNRRIVTAKLVASYQAF